MWNDAVYLLVRLGRLTCHRHQPWRSNTTYTNRQSRQRFVLLCFYSYCGESLLCPCHKYLAVHVRYRDERHEIAIVFSVFCWWSFTANHSAKVFNLRWSPPSRNLPQLGLHKRIGEQRRRFRVHASWLPPLHLRPHRVKIHEPRLEDGPCYGFQRLVHLAVQFDLVVQCAEDMGDGGTRVIVRPLDKKGFQVLSRQIRKHRACTLRKAVYQDCEPKHSKYTWYRQNWS